MTKPIGVKLDDELQARLKALGKRGERSPHWLIKKTISEFVDRKKPREKSGIYYWNDETVIRRQRVAFRMKQSSNSLKRGVQTRSSMPDKPALIGKPGALDDLTRYRECARPHHNPKAALNAAKRIIEAANLLLAHPH